MPVKKKAASRSPAKRPSKIVLNGFNKKYYTTQEVVDIMRSLGVEVIIDEKYDFAKQGGHFYVAE